ncbi:THAP domain-containing protein 5 [Gastrophryne carolinensis]
MDGITISDCKEFSCGPAVDYDMSACQIVTLELDPASLENLLTNTISDSKMCFEIPLAEQADTVTENVNAFHVNNFSNKLLAADKPLMSAAIRQTIEQLDAAGESVITIIVPNGISQRQPVLTSEVILDDRRSTDEENLYVENTFSNKSPSADEHPEAEHSYCKLDIDRNQLWQTIANLQSQISLLEVQENVTLSRLRSLEAVVAQLRQDNLLSDEKLKIIYSCLSSVDVAVVQ